MGNLILKRASASRPRARLKAGGENDQKVPPHNVRFWHEAAFRCDALISVGIRGIADIPQASRAHRVTCVTQTGTRTRSAIQNDSDQAKDSASPLCQIRIREASHVETLWREGVSNVEPPRSSRRSWHNPIRRTWLLGGAEFPKCPSDRVACTHYAIGVERPPG
jgi:hypothetical protein